MIENSLKDKINQIEKLSMRLPFMEVHDVLFILQYPFSIPKLTYILRTSPCFLRRDLLDRYDSTLLSALELVTNVHLGQKSWMQACLPVDLGGLGLGSAVDLAPCSFLSASNACHTLSTDLLSKHAVIIPAGEQPASACALQAANEITDRVGVPSKDILELESSTQCNIS